jgi:hypothetical protein
MCFQRKRLVTSRSLALTLTHHFNRNGGKAKLFPAAPKQFLSLAAGRGPTNAVREATFREKPRAESSRVEKSTTDHSDSRGGADLVRDRRTTPDG